MSDSIESLRKKIESSGDLQSVVRTMKALAASSIGQYEQSVVALANYYRTVELALGVCFRQPGTTSARGEPLAPGGAAVIGAVVFGSDQGLVGQFNEVVVDFAAQTLADLPGRTRVWCVGERAQARLADAGIAAEEHLAVPASVQAIVPLVGAILAQTEQLHDSGAIAELHLFYNRPTSKTGYAPVSQRLLPLDERWLRARTAVSWPTQGLAEVIGGGDVTLHALFHEFLFISLFRACAESLASENASRLAAMERADRNIDGLLEQFVEEFHRLRQGGIDEELFDVVSGFEAMSD
ncbi:F0F1 ATP synthase subunit gamma [Engelhardtia mirabilis]|uniref:ATP synthase gamma chain n=1 Tax=Engelhardtia mirabilis TaxID=2528011 RepID=A0A518BE60_9BACT|nr:ATP synthase gamma chain [Planctomycetes bacterium Pla133]QDU99582.1 ATP synthase gamma chain [Planctomycetes bacterium Pla86]